jgi:hypothetical protein
MCCRCCLGACRAPFPKLQKLDINCPIKQLVFGTRGSYRCMLVEQKPLTAYEFRWVLPHVANSVWESYRKLHIAVVSAQQKPTQQTSSPVQPCIA